MGLWRRAPGLHRRQHPARFGSTHTRHPLPPPPDSAVPRPHYSLEHPRHPAGPDVHRPGNRGRPKTLERAVNEADKGDVIDPDALRKALDEHRGKAGVRPLRHVLDKHTFRLSDDELELLFRPIAAAARLPTPLTKWRVNEFEVDFFWPDLGLVVETDGWRYHRTPAAQTRDALRFQTHTAAGFTPLRFSHYQVKYEPDHVLSILAKTAANLRGHPRRTAS